MTQAKKFQSGEDLSVSLAGEVRRAASAGHKLKVQGNGSKSWAPASEYILSVAEHRGVVDYQPTELVVTVRGGTPLEELNAVLAEQGQMLGAECPDFGARSTVGGAVALGWSGPRAIAAGTLSGAVLGMRMINGLGDVLQFGGQVMKNVAGFDVSRMMTGSLGTLGVILDVSLKVLPLPEQELTMEISRSDFSAAALFVRQLQQQGEPLSAAVYHQNKLTVRFSGRSETLLRLQSTVAGDVIEPLFWRQLQQMSLPMFSNPQADPIIDCHGPVSWCYRDGSLWREQGESAVSLQHGPQLQTYASGRVEILERLRSAFDPQGVFL